MNVYVKEPEGIAQACVIWMHGLGSDAKNMASLAEQLLLPVPVRHVFIEAPIRNVTVNNGMPMRAWYDVTGMKLTDREDRDGIFQSVDIIKKAITQQCDEGFTQSQIFLAGFSQGSAIALFTGLISATQLAGIIALSGYLPIAAECMPVLDKNTPVFIGCGKLDGVVLPSWTKQSADWLSLQGFKNVDWHEYPMEHSVCIQEIRDVADWITAKLSSQIQAGESHDDAR